MFVCRADNIKITKNPRSELFNNVIHKPLEGIHIESKQLQESIKISKQNNRWFIDSPVQWPANNFSVNQIVHQLNLLKESAKFTYDELIETDQNLKDFGLDDPKLTFNLKKGSQSLSLLVGIRPHLEINYYLSTRERVHLRCGKRPSKRRCSKN